MSYLAITLILTSSSMFMEQLVNKPRGDEAVGWYVPSQAMPRAPPHRASKENLPFSAGHYCGR